MRNADDTPTTSKEDTMYRGYRNLAAILTDTYEVGPMHAATATVSWAMDRLAATVGMVAARKEVSALNGARDRKGYPIAFISEWV